MLGAVAAFEAVNVAATLLILSGTDLLTPAHGLQTATTIALALYVGYNLAATVTSLYAGRVSDRLGPHGPVPVLAVGLAVFAAAYAASAVDLTSWVLLAVPFVAAGIGIGCVETAENAAVAVLAPTDLRGSAFGALATIQALGNLAASAVAGALWTWGSPTLAFGYLAGLCAASAGVLLTVSARARREPVTE